MRPAIKIIFFLTIFTMVYSMEMRADDYYYKVPNAKIVLAVNASPTDTLVLVFSTNQEESEELGSGSPVILDLNKFKIISSPKVESSQTDLNSVWKKDGDHVLFETEQGIFEASMAPPNRSLKRIVASDTMTHGIALSRSESRLAFWKWEKSSLQLVVQNAATSKIIRTWTLPSTYGGETNGFEIAFQGENAVYARTFDSEWATPLKRFDLVTGKIETVDRDCMALAPGGTGIYYVANSRPALILKKISAGKVETLSSVTGYDHLRASAGGRWIALGGRGKSAILDTSSDEISVKSICESMTMLSNGTPLYVRGVELSSNPAVCAKSR